jgi:hypothetical protein
MEVKVSKFVHFTWILSSVTRVIAEQKESCNEMALFIEQQQL